jgi:hypothetical protein
MPKFGSLGLKILKMLHIFLIVLFLGEILSSCALLLKINLSNYDEVYAAYKTFNLVSNNVVKIAAQGTILLGAVYGFLTRWSFIKHKWLAVKWLLFLAQIGFTLFAFVLSMLKPGRSRPIPGPT